MADPDDNNSSNVTDTNDQLAEKLSRLSADQQALYRNQVDLNHERNGRVSRDYQLKLADSLLKNLTNNELGREIHELNRQEDQYTYWRNQTNTEKSAKEATQAIQMLTAAEQSGPHQIQATKADRPNTLDGKKPSSQSHDYSALQHTHDQIAQQLSLAPRQTAPSKTAEQTADPAAAIQSKQHFALMIEHFPDIRREANLPTTQGEIRERADLDRAQDADRDKLDQAHGAQPNRRELQERDLLDHQHLAEQVGVQAKWIANHLKSRGSPDAEQYSKDSRQAFDTARQIHAQRQKLGAEIDRSDPAKRGAEGQQAQMQNAEQLTLQGGKTLSAEQQANLSPEARHASEGKERSAAARETTGGSKDQTVQKGDANPGKSPSGGRGGR
jgi:hypothetical protein